MNQSLEVFINTSDKLTQKNLNVYRFGAIICSKPQKLGENTHYKPPQKNEDTLTGASSSL